MQNPINTTMQFLRYSIIASVLITISSCGSIEYNPTTYPYQVEPGIITEFQSKTLILASNNFGLPSKNYLKKHESKIDKLLENRLKQAGHTLKPATHWNIAWEQAQRKYGRVYNPNTGKINKKTYQQAMSFTLNELRSLESIEFIIFTDIIEREIHYSPTTPHLTSWDGVTRKVSTQGAGHGIPDHFNWGQSSKAASLWINIIDVKGNKVFSSAGGLDITEAINLKDSIRFKRKRKLLNKLDNLNEGISLALHPLVEMQSYPGNKPGLIAE